MNRTGQYIAEYNKEFSILTGSVPDIMGTRLIVLLSGVEEQTGKSALRQMAEEVTRLDSMLSRFNPESAVFKLNACADSGWQSADDEIVVILDTCKNYYQKTLGIFDVTKGSRSAFETKPGYVNLYGAELDFGGFAKGYFLEKASNTIKAAGIPGALVCFGQSSTLAVGSHPCGAGWKVSVCSPYDNKTLDEIVLMDSSLSVSGNRPGYNRHLLDPRTGTYYSGKKTAVVVSGSPLDAEILSTAAMLASESELDTIRHNMDNSNISIYE